MSDQIPLKPLTAFTAGLVLLLCYPVMATSAEPVAAVETVAVVQKTLAENLEVFGSVQADPDYVTSLTLPRAGLITQVSVRLGQRVGSGDKILALDTAPDARAQYLQAKAALDYAQNQLERLQRLRQEQLATNDQVKAAQRSKSDAQAQLQALQRTGSDKTSAAFRSSFDGVVTALNVSQGDRVQANTTVALLTQDNHLVVILGIEPEDARLVKPGAKVTLSSVFDPSVRLESEVGAVHALVNPATRLIDVLVPIPADKAAMLTLASTMRASIALDTQALLAIPRRALVYDGQDALVFRVNNGHAQQVKVTVIQAEGAFVGVRGDLQVGDEIVTTGSYQLTDGIAVRALAP